MQEVTQIETVHFPSLRSLPGWATDDARVPSQSLLSALEIDHLVSEEARSAKWSPILSELELQEVLTTIKSRGGSGLFPGLYELLSIEGKLGDSLNQGKVYRLLDGAALMALVRDERISSLKSNWVLAVTSTTERDLEAALWFACSPEVLLTLGKGTLGFIVAFEGPFPKNGSFCSALRLSDDPCIVYGLSIQ